MKTGLAQRRGLTPIQKRILRLLLDQNSEAESSVEIAEELHISKDAVDHQMSRAYAFFWSEDFSRALASL